MADDPQVLTNRLTLLETRVNNLQAARVSPGGSNFNLWMDFDAQFYLGAQPTDLVEVRANASASNLVMTSPQGVTPDTFAAATIRRHPQGLLVEPNLPGNLFVNPTAPATQTITLGTGTYNFWAQVVGGGSSIAVSAGTGVATAKEVTLFTNIQTVPSVNLGAARQGYYVQLTVTTGGTFVFTKTGTVSNAQLALGPAPSSLIVANSIARSATQLRLADAVFASLFNPTAFTVFMEVIPFTDGTQNGTENFFYLSDGTSNNRVGAGRGAASNNQAIRVVTAGVNQWGPSAGLVPRQTNKLALAISAAGGAAYCVNGGTPVTGSIANMPTGLTKFYLGADQGGGAPMAGIISKVGLSSIRETNNAIQALTRVY